MRFWNYSGIQYTNVHTEFLILKTVLIARLANVKPIPGIWKISLAHQSARSGFDKTCNHVILDRRLQPIYKEQGNAFVLSPRRKIPIAGFWQSFY
jgi:hypothetical protein